MAFVWSERTTLEGVQFSGWDPYAKPRGEWLFEWFAILFPVIVTALDLTLMERPREFPYWAVVIAVLLVVASACLRTYQLTVTRRGFRLRRCWLGIPWFDRAFPPEVSIFPAEDLFEPPWASPTGITIQVPTDTGNLTESYIDFARGKDCVESLERIKQVAIAQGVWQCTERTDQREHHVQQLEI
jgi:hypothetical protein